MYAIGVLKGTSFLVYGVIFFRSRAMVLSIARLMKAVALSFMLDACTFPSREDDKFVILPYFWILEDTLELRVRRDYVPYDVWERQGFKDMNGT